MIDGLRGVLVFILTIFSVSCSSAETPLPIPSSAKIDSEMKAASAQARDTLDSFIQRIGTPHADRTYIALKVRLVLPDGPQQDIWVDVVTYTDGVFRGNMGDDIPSLRLVLGEKITIPVEDIIDWMIVEDGKLVGGFTIRLAVRRMSPEEKEKFFEAIDYCIED